MYRAVCRTGHSVVWELTCTYLWLTFDLPFRVCRCRGCATHSVSWRVERTDCGMNAVRLPVRGKGRGKGRERALWTSDSACSRWSSVPMTSPRLPNSSWCSSTESPHSLTQSVTQSVTYSVTYSVVSCQVSRIVKLLAVWDSLRWE